MPRHIARPALPRERLFGYPPLTGRYQALEVYSVRSARYSEAMNTARLKAAAIPARDPAAECLIPGSMGPEVGSAKARDQGVPAREAIVMGPLDQRREAEVLAHVDMDRRLGEHGMAAFAIEIA